MDTRSIYTGTQGAVRDTNKVLRNTYMLLSLTLGFSAVVAGVATVMNMPPLHWAVFLIGVYGLMFLTEKNRDNGMGLVFTFALTGLLGYNGLARLAAPIDAELEGLAHDLRELLQAP